MEDVTPKGEGLSNTQQAGSTCPTCGWIYAKGEAPPCPRCEVPLQEPVFIRHSIRVHYSTEDQAYIAEIPELPGCKADGDTHENAVRSVIRSAHAWFEAAEKLKRKIPSPILYREHLEKERDSEEQK